MASGFLVSTLIFGVLLLGVASFLRGLRQWRDDKPKLESSGFDSISGATKNPRVWIAAYAIGMIAAAGAAWAYIGGDAIPKPVADASLIVLGAVLGIAIFVLIARGTYDAVRGHGRSASQAAAMGGAAVGFTLVALVAVRLITA